ncbi:MAG TPA: hypothetical protein VML50_09675 [Anaeromyxobacter sp.]|nr:hypothetical protein [Anaeromyxobacter sp.]
MQEASFDPTRPTAMKLHVDPAETPAPDPAGLKVRIAEQVRVDSRERHALTPEHAVRRLAPGLPREQLAALLSEMAAEGRYGDIKAIVAPSGRVYLFSEAHLIALEAQERGRAEEAKLAMVERIRADSRKVALTPVADLDPLVPGADPARRDALLAELQADERFRDIRTVTGPGGERYCHSDAFVSGTYSQIMMRAKTRDACLGIAELVRERSRTLPKPTRLTTFEDPVFGIDPGRLEAAVEETLSRPEYADIKRLVHPETGGVYLYSDRFLAPQQAFLIMDWDEVGAARNP